LQLEVDLADVVVFGDNDNDVDMFEIAGHAVALANCSSLERRKASEIIGSNDEDAARTIRASSSRATRFPSMTSQQLVTGGCACGAVRYRISAAPIVTRICWCRVCQYFAAGNGTVNCAFRTPAVQIEGELRDFRSVADSGDVMHRRFCPTCGTHLFSEAEERPHLIIVRAGTFDDASITKPEMTIWTASAPSWARIDPELPNVPGQPPPAA
jgi:hypothetical protein